MFEVLKRPFKHRLSIEPTIVPGELNCTLSVPPVMINVPCDSFTYSIQIHVIIWRNLFIFFSTKFFAIIISSIKHKLLYITVVFTLKRLFPKRAYNMPHIGLRRWRIEKLWLYFSLIFRIEKHQVMVLQITSFVLNSLLHLSGKCILFSNDSIFKGHLHRLEYLRFHRIFHLNWIIF